jgi:hypothetical protein
MFQKVFTLTPWCTAEFDQYHELLAWNTNNVFIIYFFWGPLASHVDGLNVHSS